jgi:hypothetical protein
VFASLFRAGAEIQRVTHERASKMKRQMRTDLQGKTTLLCTRVTVSHTDSHNASEPGCLMFILKTIGRRLDCAREEI